MKRLEVFYNKKIISLLSLLFIASAVLNAQFAPQPEPEITAAASVSENNKNAVIRVLYKFPENFHQTLNRDFFRAEVTDPGGLVFETEYAEGIEEKGEINFYGTTELLLEGDISNLGEGIHTFTIKASYQLCDENGTCYFPGSKEISADLEISSQADESRTTSLFEDSRRFDFFSGIFKYLFLAFLGGLLLNIMPCVFPLLSIKALSLVKQSEKGRKEIFVSSLFYSAGIIASLLVLSLFLIVIKNAGQFAGWGFQMQNRWFVLFLVSVIYLFALSMFDVFTITLPGVNTAGKLSSRKGYTGHFLTGIFAVLVAAPCTAPFLGSAIAFSLSGSSLMILSSFLFIGIGFAFPFLIIGMNPALVRLLPKPGKWSVYFKEILGFILAGTALYLLISFSKGKPSSALSSIVVYLFIITFLAWIYGKTAMAGISKKHSIIILFMVFILSVVSALTVPDFNYDEKQVSSSSAAEGFSEKKLFELLSEGKSVFVDIYADWCTTCKINERLVLNTDEVKKLFSDMNTVLLKGDFTDGNSEISEWMKKNNKAGVPVYAFYRDKGSSPVFLPEILTKKKLSEIITSGNMQ